MIACLPFLTQQGSKCLSAIAFFAKDVEKMALGVAALETLLILALILVGVIILICFGMLIVRWQDSPRGGRFAMATCMFFFLFLLVCLFLVYVYMRKVAGEFRNNDPKSVEQVQPSSDGN